MKKKILLTMMGALMLCTGALFAQTTRLAFWDFEGSDGDPYSFYREDEYGTVRAWVIPNESTEKNANAKFSAYREGKDSDGIDIAYYLGMTRATTTIFGGSCLAAQNWDNIEMRSVRYWYLENISTEGMTDVTISLYLTCAGVGGPGKFKFGYKIGDGPWIDNADFKDVRINVTASGNFVGSDPADLWVHNLPATCNNQAKISCRWLSNDLRADGTPIAASSYSRLDNVEVKAVSASSIPNAKTAPLVYVEGSYLIGETDANVTVSTTLGAIVYAGPISKGESIELSKGIYIVKATSNTLTETIKILVK